MIYLQLYWSFFKIGLFSIGGGYASLPLIEKEIVDLHGWLTMTEFTDIITISQMTPGPIAINTSTFVGTQIGGVLGAIIATLGCVSPSFIIVLSLAYIYVKYKNVKVISDVLYGLRPAVVSLIGVAGISIVMLAFFGEKKLNISNFYFDWSGIHLTIKDININLIAILFFGAGFYYLRKYKGNPIYVMIGSGIAGAIIYNILGV